MTNCVFCKIIEGEIPNHTIYEDDKVLAFLDIKPHARGHTVVIPKKHGEFLEDFSEGEFSSIMIKVKKIVEILKEKLKPDGFNVGWNNGSAAGQVIPHLHIHIMPRYNRDGGGSMHSIISNPGDKSVDEIAKLFND